jgi:hypothetical protein
LLIKHTNGYIGNILLVMDELLSHQGQAMIQYAERTGIHLVAKIINGCATLDKLVAP